MHQQLFVVVIASEFGGRIETLSPGFLDDCCAGFGCCFVQGRDMVDFDLSIERRLQSWFEVVGVVVFSVVVTVIMRMVVIGHCRRVSCV